LERCKIGGKLVLFTNTKSHMGFQLAVADPGIVGRGMMYPVSYHPTPFCLFSASPSLSFAAAGPVTLELRSSRLSRAQKILPSMARAWPITVFFCADTATAVRCYRVLIAPNKHSPRSIYHAQHHARITLELRPLCLYRDQSIGTKNSDLE